MRITPYLMFQGDADEAIAFYKDALRGEITGVVRYKDEPGPGAGRPAMVGKMLHGELAFKDLVIYFSDQETPVTVGDRLSITLDCDSAEEERGIFDALKVGGAVSMDLQDTFWGAIYGMVTDKYGVGWGLNFTKAK